jgi:hypothetical protein
VACGGDERRRDEGEARFEWDQIAVHRPDDAVETMPAEPRPPVEIRLEHPACEARRHRQPDCQEQRARDREGITLAALEQCALSHAHGDERAHRDRQHAAKAERDERDSRNERAAGLVLQKLGRP